MGGDFLADDEKEIVGPCVIHELELFANVLEGGLEIRMGTEVSLKPAVSFFELQHPLGIVRYGLQFTAISNHPCVFG